MKKRYCCAAALLAASLLFGCSSESTPKNTVTDFSSSVVIMYNEEKTECSLSSNLSGITLTIDSGNMAGLTYSCIGEEVKAQFSDISISNDQSQFKESMPYALYSAIKSLRNSEEPELIETNEEKSFYQGKNEVGDFSAEIDSQSGYITKIEYDSIGLTAEFSDVNEYK